MPRHLHAFKSGCDHINNDTAIRLGTQAPLLPRTAEIGPFAEMIAGVRSLEPLDTAPSCLELTLK
jgi:hypothetical protein